MPVRGLVENTSRGFGNRFKALNAWQNSSQCGKRAPERCYYRQSVMGGQFLQMLACEWVADLVVATWKRHLSDGKLDSFIYQSLRWTVLREDAAISPRILYCFWAFDLWAQDSITSVYRISKGNLRAAVFLRTTTSTEKHLPDENWYKGKKKTVIMGAAGAQSAL